MLGAAVLAILSPLFWALMNTIDKYAISKKVKHPLGFVAVVGTVQLILGAMLAIFLDWNSISLNSIIFPIVAGILIGAQAYFYYFILQKEDVSYLVGLAYCYPVLVIAFSFMFLNEVLGPIAYLGAALIISCSLMISVRLR